MEPSGLTYRDANAATIADFLDPRRAAFLEPPTLAGAPQGGEAACSDADPVLPVPPDSARGGAGSRGGSAGRELQELQVRFYGRHHASHGLLVRLRVSTGELSNLSGEFRHGHRVLARTPVRRLTSKRRRVVHKPHHRARVPNGNYTLVVKHGAQAIFHRTIHLR